jgi:raffinose/stachyose/melibiose transport system permease protein
MPDAESAVLPSARRAWSLGGLRKVADERAPGESRLVPFLFVLPALTVFSLFVIAPVFHGAWISFFDWDGVTPKRWIGLDNYRQLLHDATVRSAFGHSLVLIGFYSALPVGLGLLIAAIFSNARIRGLTALRTTIFVPQILAAVVIGVSWQWVYDPSGPLNTALHAVGLGSLRHAWLGDFSTALPAVGVVGTWVTTGLCVVLFLAGIQKIPESRYEAARVDGAGLVREFFAVTLPGLRGELAVAISLTVITALRAFDVIFVTTLGGPGSATSVPSLLIYQRAFVYGQVGSAAAIAVVLSLIILAIAIGITRLVEGAGE